MGFKDFADRIQIGVERPRQEHHLMVGDADVRELQYFFSSQPDFVVSAGAAPYFHRGSRGAREQGSKRFFLSLALLFASSLAHTFAGERRIFEQLLRIGVSRISLLVREIDPSIRMAGQGQYKIQLNAGQVIETI